MNTEVPHNDAAILSASNAIAPEASTEVVEYSETVAGLSALRDRLANIVYDVTTTAGMTAARQDRRELVSLRTELDRLRLKKNADDHGRIKHRNEVAKRLNEEIVLLESPIDEAIKAEEKRKEEARAAREAAELERVTAIRARIAALMRRPAEAIGMDSAGVRAMREELEAARLDSGWSEAFAEFANEARGAREAGIEFLVDLEAKKVAAEEQDRQRTQEAEKQAQARREQEAAEQSLANERAAVAAREQAVRDEERRQQEERDRLAAEAAAAVRKRDEEAAAAERKHEAQEEKRKADEADAALRAEDARLMAELRETDHGLALADDAEWTARQQEAAQRLAEHKRVALAQARLGRMAVRKQVREQCTTELDALRAIFELCKSELVSDAQFRSQAYVLAEAFVVGDEPCPSS